MAMAANQEQIAALLKALVGKGIETMDAIPTIKVLVEAKIFSLDDITAENVPSSLDAKIRKKLLPQKKKRSSSASSPSKKRKTNIVIPSVTSTPVTIMINRSPVLTLWAAIVAKRIYSLTRWEEALTFGSAFAAQTARGKGTTLGIYSSESAADALDADAAGSSSTRDLMGQTIHVVTTTDGIRAVANGGQEQDPSRTFHHLEKKFGTALGFVVVKMMEAADAAGDNLSSTAYQYYMHIRPSIPEGTKGWGAHGQLETSKLSHFYEQKNAVAAKAET